MAYCKKLFFILLFTLFFVLFTKNNCFGVSVITEEIPSAVWDSFKNYILKGSNGFYDSGNTWAESLSYAKNFIIMSGAYNHYLFMFFEDGYLNTSSNKFIYNNVNCPRGSYNYFWIEFNPDGSYAGHSGGGRNGYYYFSNGGVANIWYPNLIYSSFDIYDQNNNLILSGSGGGFDDAQPSLDIRFPTASTNLIGIAQGTERTIEVELLHYDVEQMPDTLYLNFYKKQGDNYNIYSIPIYIYHQFPTYVTQAPLNDDLFLFIDKSKLYSMGINFQSSDEFYLFLSNDVAPKGYTTWNDNGTGLLLGTTFETTDATIYDESGLITIPTLTTEQEQDNQNQSDTQKQIDAINKQTEEQKETKDFLTDDHIEDDNISLPSIETNDITEDGIDNIFTAIYNGLTSGEAKDIVLPFPFTNKSITIPANYTEQFLTTSAFSPIYAIIQAFYWYIIARFIIKDIANKFEKIKSGSIENIENNNIKTDML